MSFGDRPPYDDGATNVTADALLKRQQCHDAIFELDTMKAMGKTLDKLPGGAVRRILSWLADRYGYTLAPVDGVQLLPVRDTEPMPPLDRNPVQVVPWTPPGLGQVVCNGMPVWGE